ncbi:family 20 glycosylhydrolase [Salegentibacter salegens]|uniref:Glycosyl hydrolase family 20, catalytic domain n=1 Tax=Salegentibacter salegens TaxID=143223 RepID=A0A1M7ME63_9FLAO|nr:family 20 glycosylhydrolase [Salegentibacter salegens]PRX51637.1 glycosyl hydrolase family 20 [Salegentibacter salegens]SHM89082.1 Glycosyl hydrolase family 20, catalytic domain [Salegentibacter salegens]
MYHKAIKKRSSYNLSNFLLTTFFILVTLSISAQEQFESKDDFDVKGFHLDLRIQIMTPKALKEFASEIADMGLNTLVMEWEATYPYEKHATISNEYSYSREEIEDFIKYCNNLGIQVIPLQQSLGHVEYILRHPRYNHFKVDQKDISQLSPMKIQQSSILFEELFSDLASMHKSDYIHIGGDETRLLEECEGCQKKIKEQGKSKVFVDHMKSMAEIVIGLGKKPVMWADMILKYPEAAKELPKETILVDWNYGWKINHFGDVSKLQEMGFTFWGAPAIRSHPDNWYVTDWKTHFNNQKKFIPYARQAGYEGIVMTSWSTTGLYGFTWDVGYEVIDMTQIRNTYPMSGFRILIASYVESLNSKDSINPEDFVLQYSRERFGLEKEDGRILWDYFSKPVELIQNGKPEKSKSIEQMQFDYGQLNEKLNRINPKRNITEFNHLKLMADLRMHYLKFKAIEARYNSPEFSIDQTPELAEELENIFDEAKVLNRRFTALNKGFLYDSEIKEQNDIRIQPVQVLYDRLVKLK